jgi:hypothetical protein
MWECLSGSVELWQKLIFIKKIQFMTSPHPKYIGPSPKEKEFYFVKTPS